MSSDKKMKVIIGILIAIIIGIVLFIILTAKTNNAKFVDDLINTQAKVSKYIGQIESETFNAYTEEEIILGKTNDDKIKNINEKELIPLVDEDNKVENGTVKYYPINDENLKTQFGIDLSEYSEIKWYISSNGYVKVKLESKPKWWSANFNSLIIN